MMYYARLSPAFDRFVGSLLGGKAAVIGHARPDGDCIGSQVALARVLRSRGVEDVVCLNRDPVPRRLAFLAAGEPFFNAGEWKPDGHVSVCVDCADRDRPGEEFQSLFPGIEVNIDHHISNTQYARIDFVDSDAAATAEILAGFFLDEGYEIDSATACALYAGIATDTGQFRFPSTSRRVFDICGRLVELGADPALVSNHLYERETLGKMKLLQAYLATLKMECGSRVCIGVLEKGVFDRTGASVEDTEGLVDYARAIHGVEIAVIVEDRGNEVKGSLRAKEVRYRVDEVAARFNGGGHACAAGFRVEKPLEAFYPEFIDALDAHLSAVDAGTAKD